MKTGKEQQSSLGATLIAGAGVGGIGCAVPILVVAAIFAGRWVDRQLGTAPWALMTLLLASIVGGVVFMISSAVSAARAAQQQHDSSRRAGPVDSFPDDPHDQYGEENH